MQSKYYTIFQVWNLERKEVKMKEGIHPEYKKTTIKCVCGNEIETGSVQENITVEICNKCHPFYTGQQKILDSEGRVERFNKRYGKKN
jgi:large subunit ribosomal protein L31